MHVSIKSNYNILNIRLIKISPHDKADPCEYIRQNENCEPDGYFDYLELYYCKLKGKEWASYIIMVTLIYFHNELYNINLMYIR